MHCRSCPHHVRHGKPSTDGRSIEFSNSCALRMKTNEDGKRRSEDTSCVSYPFPVSFDYMSCGVYQQVFKSGIRRNDVVPTKDFQYSEALAGGSITDLELL